MSKVVFSITDVQVAMLEKVRVAHPAGWRIEFGRSVELTAGGLVRRGWCREDYQYSRRLLLTDEGWRVLDFVDSLAKPEGRS